MKVKVDQEEDAETVVYLAKTEPAYLPETVVKTSEGHKVYDTVCLKDNLLVQWWETVTNYGVNGYIFITLEGCKEDKEKWPYLTADAQLYWSGDFRVRPYFFRKARMHDVLVHWEYQRKGLGFMLVNKAEERMRFYGMREIGGRATEDGMKFWPTQGYALEGREIKKILPDKVTVKVSDIEKQMGMTELRYEARKYGVTPNQTKRSLIIALMGKGFPE